MVQLPVARDRTLFLAKQVDQESINHISREILEINSSDEYLGKIAELHGMIYTSKPIKLYIDSYGGLVYQCLGLLGIMEKSKVPVHTIVTGAAMSCGFMIAITGHRRYAYDKATLMYHQVSNGFYGKVKDMEEDLEETKRLQLFIEDHTLSKTKITREQLRENYKRKKDWYMPSKKALKLGVIDEIL